MKNAAMMLVDDESGETGLLWQNEGMFGGSRQL